MLFYKGLQLQEHLPLSAMLFVFNIYKESCVKAEKIKGGFLQWNVIQSMRNLKIFLRVISLQGQIVKRITLKKHFAFLHIKKIIPILRLLSWYKDKEEKTESDINKDMDNVACRIAAEHDFTPRQVLDDFTISQVTEFQKAALMLKIQKITLQYRLACAQFSTDAHEKINETLSQLHEDLGKFPGVEKYEPKRKKFAGFRALIPSTKIL